MKSFIEELKKRRVYRFAIAYALVASALVQLAGTVLPTFHAPDWMQQVFMVLVGLGFPIGLVLAWGFDLKDGEIIRTESEQGVHASTNRRRISVLAAVGCLLALLFMVANWWWHPWRAAHTPPVSVSASPAEELFSEIPEKSIAVLPFTNLSDNKENGYFSDGVQDEILTDLARVADLKVISRASVMPYRAGMQRNLREIALGLGVAYVLEGSVQRDGSRVRVNAQLIDARIDKHVWAEHYDRGISDIFAVQSEVAEQIAAQLKVRLSSEEKLAIEQEPTKDALAYDLFIRGKLAITTAFAYNARLNDSLREGVRLLDAAVERDPRFFLAYCRLAQAHDYMFLLGYDQTPGRYALAEMAVDKATELRPDAGETHLAIAQHLYSGKRDYDRARAELEIAHKLLPNNPLPILLSGYIDRRQGRWDESTRKIEAALALDPRNFDILQQLSLSYGYLRRFNEMRAILDRALTIKPHDPGARSQRAGIALEANADPAPLRTEIAAIVSEDSQAAGRIADEWLYLGLCQRDRSAATRAVAAMDADGCNNEGIPFPRQWCEGLVARTFGDRTKSEIAFAAAREEIAHTLRDAPTHAGALGALAMIDAALGHGADAIAESQRAIQLLPVEKDAIAGARLAEFLAIVYAWTGNKDRALEQLATAVRLPGEITYGQLRLHPYWDPLRGDPRFDKIVGSLAPK
ncbi:MAG: TPR end-of-group domain-containing protein [Chthoniobacterales bacterium]